MGDILKAFIEQTYGSLEKAREADKLADINPNASGNENLEFEQDQKFRQELASKMKNIPISHSMSIPTQIKDGELNNKPVSHPQFAKYDHSLEFDRTAIVRAKYLDEKYKNNPKDRPEAIDFKELETGSVEEIFDRLKDN